MNNLRELRLKAGLTQVELAKLAGVYNQQISTWERGGNITMASIRKLEAIIGRVSPVGKAECEAYKRGKEDAIRSVLGFLCLAAGPPDDGSTEPVISLADAIAGVRELRSE